MGGCVTERESVGVPRETSEEKHRSAGARRAQAAHLFERNQMISNRPYVNKTCPACGETFIGYECIDCDTRPAECPECHGEKKHGKLPDVTFRKTDGIYHEANLYVRPFEG